MEKLTAIIPTFNEEHNIVSEIPGRKINARRRKITEGRKITDSVAIKTTDSITVKTTDRPSTTTATTETHTCLAVIILMITR